MIRLKQNIYRGTAPCATIMPIHAEDKNNHAVPSQGAWPALATLRATLLVAGNDILSHTLNKPFVD